jgi:cold shock CspA family protein
MLMTHRETHVSRRFGFVTFTSVGPVEKLVVSGRSVELKLDGNTVEVKHANEITFESVLSDVPKTIVKLPKLRQLFLWQKGTIVKCRNSHGLIKPDDGFLQPDDGSGCVIYHVSKITDGKLLSLGSFVEYTLNYSTTTKGKNKYKAAHVRAIRDTKLDWSYQRGACNRAQSCRLSHKESISGGHMDASVDDEVLNKSPHQLDGRTISPKFTVALEQEKSFWVCTPALLLPIHYPTCPAPPSHCIVFV